MVEHEKLVKPSLFIFAHTPFRNFLVPLKTSITFDGWLWITFIAFLFFQESESEILMRNLPQDKEMYYADSYEELLSTAIINKVRYNA